MEEQQVSMDDILNINQEFYAYVGTLEIDHEIIANLISKHMQVIDKLTAFVKDRIARTQNIMNDHALNMQYLIFDLESTKREKELLQKKLEDLEN